jgi:hypothetical protein
MVILNEPLFGWLLLVLGFLALRLVRREALANSLNRGGDFELYLFGEFLAVFLGGHGKALSIRSGR